MRKRADYLSDLADALAASQSDRLDQLVQGAYRAGASREELLVAVEVGRQCARVPVPVLVRAHAAIEFWWEGPRRHPTSRRQRPKRSKTTG